MTKQRNLSKDELLAAKAQVKHNQLKNEFNQKLEELIDWGFERGVIINAYLKADHSGIIPYISFLYMSKQEQEQYDGWKKSQIKEDQALKKDPAIRKEV
jgi:hypothetical protein